MQDVPTPLGGMPPATFLRDYWQKRPLLIRQAIPGFQSPLTPEELAGLACEADVESRLVLEQTQEGPWQVRHGPFSEHDFHSLPDSHWTLLVQEVNRHVPEATELMDRFCFIPDWRMDDVMVSFAPTGGSVGPHVDHYDVFLVQAQGRRRWGIASAESTDRTLLPDLELGILANFVPEEAWELEPGDMLYLPPGVAHHGVALGACQTWSVGFRAPSLADMLTAAAGHLADRLDPDTRYTDPDLTRQTNPGEITPAALAKVGDLRRVLWDKVDDAEWFGCLVTENHSGPDPEPVPVPVTNAEFRALLQIRGTLHRREGTRFAYASRPNGEALLFVDGHAHPLAPAVGFAAPALCRHRTVYQTALAPGLEDSRLLELLTGLYNQGYVYFTE